MKRLVFILLLAGCRTVPAHEEIQNLLRQDPINVARLREIFQTDEGSIRIIPPPPQALSFAPTTGPWTLFNTGKRPVWIKRSDLELKANFTPFVPDPNREPFGESGFWLEPQPHPTFDPADWTRLEPGERLIHHADPGQAAHLWWRRKLNKPGKAGDQRLGDYQMSLIVPKSEQLLCSEAERFNARMEKPAGYNNALVPIRHPAFTQTVLPGFDWNGAPWHGGDSIDPHPLGDGKFEIVTQVETDSETLHPLPLEAFVVRGDQDLVFRGSLRIEGFEGEKPRFRREVHGDRVRIRIVYSLPDPIRPGSYRILVRAENAYDFFCQFQGSKNHLCDMPDGAASRWIPFEVH